MTKQYPSKQYLSEVISNREFAEGVPPEIVIVMAHQLLASMEQDPVVWVMKDDLADADIISTPAYPALSDATRKTIGELIPLYAAPQLQQPAVAITQHFDTIALDTAKMVMCDVNRRDEFLGGDIQLLSRIQCRIDEAWRAAMLQGADGNSPVIPDGWAMVPIDATRAMINAAERVEEDGYDAMHKAIIAAAPQQQVKK